MSSSLTPRHSPLRIVFAGTPDFAATALAALFDTPHEICAVYTQPDRPAGRGRKLKPGPVKQLALEHDIPVCQPVNFKSAEDIEALKAWQADLMIVAAYGLLLPKTVLEAPRLGCLNIHASLLPRWRGAAPIQRAILAGDNETGITIMQMDEGLDTGDMLLKLPCPIHASDTGGSLHDRLAELGATAIKQALDGLLEHSLQPQRQDEREATYARKLEKQEAVIDWQQPALAIDRQIRAFNPWPVCFTYINSKPLRIWESEVIQNNTSHSTAGTVLACTKQGIDIACGEGSLRMKKIQPAGGKALDVAAFLNGHPDALPVGSQLQTPDQ